jgi:hypothetical protein
MWPGWVLFGIGCVIMIVALLATIHYFNRLTIFKKQKEAFLSKDHEIDMETFQYSLLKFANYHKVPLRQINQMISVDYRKQIWDLTKFDI